MASNRRPLTKQEIRATRERLRVFMSPEEMLRETDNVLLILGTHFFRQAGLEFLRDAWTAGHVAAARQSHQVRLCSADRPDFELLEAAGSTLFEVVEADRPGRRRGDEYKLMVEDDDEDAAVEVTLGPDDPAETRPEFVAEMLASAARKKADGRYDPSCGLVIHLNSRVYGPSFKRQVEELMLGATSPAHGKFSEIVIWWANTAYSIVQRERA